MIRPIIMLLLAILVTALGIPSKGAERLYYDCDFGGEEKIDTGTSEEVDEPVQEGVESPSNDGFDEAAEAQKIFNDAEL